MINPILERELKSRMRTWRTPIIITIYLVLIGLLVTFFFLVSGVNYRYSGEGFNPEIVSTIYNAIVIFQLILLLLILPIFTAVSITGERERQTLDLLLCTDILPWRILTGKMASALSFVLLMVIAAMPFVGIVLLFGGISIWDIILIVLYYMATAFMVSTIGIFTTTHFKRNMTSIIMSYLLLGCILFIPIFALALTSVLIEGPLDGTVVETFFEDHTYELLSFTFASNPFFGLTSLLNGDIFNISSIIGGTTSVWRRVKPWMNCLLFYGVFSSLLLFLSKRRLARLK